MTPYEADIRKYIIDSFLFGEGQALDGGASLLEAGIVNSTGLLELVGHIEKSYGIKIEDDELVPDNFDTIAGICAFLERKMPRASSRVE